MNPFKYKLHWQILIALVFAIGLGVVINNHLGGIADDSRPAWSVVILEISEFLGTLFLRALKMIVIPLIMSSIILAVMNIGRDKSFGRLGLKTLVYYFGTGLSAVIIGLVVVNVFQPGDVEQATREAMVAGAQAKDVGSLISEAEGRSGKDVIKIFINMVPPNIFKAAVEGQFLALIFFSILFGFFTSKLPDDLLASQRTFWQGLNGIITAMTDFIIMFAPIGVFGLVLPTIATTGTELFGTMGYFAFTVLVALGLHFFGVIPLVIALVAKENPIKQYRAMAPAILTAFSTASSASTLPVTMECVQKNAGVSKRVSSFTLPLGATVNMDGTALFECVVVIFLAQLFGIEMTLVTQFSVVVLALLTSIGVAGIPHASLVAIVVILSSVGFPPELIETGIGIVFIVDRILDMCRTAVNIFGDSCGAVVIGKTEGEQGYYGTSNIEHY